MSSNVLDKVFGRLGNRMFQLFFIYALAKRGQIPDIYLQSDEYFSEFKDDIKEILRQDVKENDMVGIHVRRGDYVDNPFYVDLTKTDYYDKAMKLFPGERFIIFSDDIDWCKAKDTFRGCKFAIGSEWEDFNFLAGCKHVITANSSFSWWAGYACNGKVVAPIEWYTDKVERTKCPKEWIRL